LERLLRRRHSAASLPDRIAGAIDEVLEKLATAAAS